MRLKLKNEYCIRKEEEFAIIFDRRTEKIQKKLNRISLAEYELLKLFCGKYTIPQIYELLSIKNEYAAVKEYIDGFCNKYKGYLEKCTENDVRTDIVINKTYFKKEYFESVLRLSTPLFISLVITKKCTSYCKYCFSDSNKPDVQSVFLDIKDISRLLDEFKKLGVANINITGGDPFSHPEIMKILELVISTGIDFNISTKKILTDCEIRRIKNIGLKELQISLDSSNNEIASYLTGVDNYYEKMKNVILELLKKEINVKVNSVLTSYNIETIPMLINDLEDIGVKTLFLTPYNNSLGRHDDLFFPTFSQYENLNKYLCEYHGKVNIDYQSPRIHSEEKKLSDIQNCSGGRMGLVVFPNGNVSICERILNDELSVGSIKKETILEIWQGDALATLLKSKKDSFTGTKCFDCENYNLCIIKKGLCFARAKMINDSFWSNDPLCPQDINVYRFS